MYIHDPEDHEDNWKRVLILSRNTEGKKSKWGPHFNVEMDNKRMGLYLEMYDWHFEGAGYHSPKTTKLEVRNYLMFQDEDIEDIVYDFDAKGIIREPDDDQEFISYVNFVPPSKYNTAAIINAKKKELSHFVDYNVYTPVSDVGQNRITS